MSYEADPRHADEIIKQTGAIDMKPVTTPMVKSNIEESTEDKAQAAAIKKMTPKKKKTKGSYDYEYDDHEDELDAGSAMPLSRERTTEYRGITARGNFLAVDRGDLIYPVKEFSRSMSAPTERDWQRVVR